VAHLTVSMAFQFYDFYLWPLRNTAWPPLRTTGLKNTKEHNVSETDIVSETLCYLVFFRVTDDGQSPKTH
jgi:hypothetical protein